MGSQDLEMPTQDDKIIGFLNRVIRQIARVVAIIMVVVITFGVADIVYVLYQRLMDPRPPDAQDHRDHRLAVEIVLGTALMAISRKVIVFDFDEVIPLSSMDRPQSFLPCPSATT